MTLTELIVKIGADISDYTDGIDKAIAKTEESKASFASAGAALSAAFTVPLAGLGVAALEAAGSAKEAFNIIRVNTGAVGESLDALKENFSRVFQAIPNSAKDVGTAIADLAARLDLTGQPLENLSTQILNLSRITNSSLEPLIAGVTRLFGDWSIATKDQGSALDYLFKVFQNTGIGVTRLSELVVQFGAPMRALGFSFEDAAALLGKFEKEGVNIETVMPGLRRELGNFAKAGVDAAGGFGAIIESIKNAKTDAEGLTIALSVFGQRAATDMFRAIKEGRFDIDAFAEKLKSSTETINNASDSTQTLGQKMAIAGHQIEEALAPLGRVLGTALKEGLADAQPLLAVIKDMGEAFAGMSPTLQTVVVGLGALVAAAGPAALGIVGIQKAIGIFSAAAATIGGVFTGLVTAIGTVIFAVSSGLTGALTAGETALLRLGQAGILAAGVFAGWKLGAWLYDNVSAIKAFGDALGDIILKIPGLQRLIDWLQGAKAGLANTQGQAGVLATNLEDRLLAKGITDGVGANRDPGMSDEQYQAYLYQLSVQYKAPPAAQSGGGAKKPPPDLSNLLHKGPNAEDKAFSTFGLTDYQKQLDDLLKSYDVLEASGKATEDQLDQAWETVKRAIAAANGEVVQFTKYSEAVKFGTGSFDSALLVKQYDDAVNAQKKLIDQSAGLRKAIDDQNQAYSDATLVELGLTDGLTQVRLNAAYDVLAFQNLQASIDTGLVPGMDRATQSVTAAKAAFKAFGDVNPAIVGALSSAVTSTNAEVDQLNKAYKTLGVTRQSDLSEQANALTTIEAGYKAGIVTAHDYLQAEYNFYKADIENRKAYGQEVSSQEAKQLADLKKQLDGMKATHAEAIKAVQALYSQLSDSLSKGFTNALFKGSGFLDALKSGVEDLAKTITEKLIKGALVDLGSALLKLPTNGKGLSDIFTGIGSLFTQSKTGGSSLPGIGSLSTLLSPSKGVVSDLPEGVAPAGVPADILNAALSPLIKTAEKAATDTSKIATSTASTATSTASSATSALGTLGSLSSIANIASAVTGIASGIVSGIQQAHMSSDLQKIEESTRYVKITMVEQNPVGINVALMRDRLNDIQNYLLSVQQSLLDDIKNGMANGLASLAGNFGDSLGKVIDGLRGISDSMAPLIDALKATLDAVGAADPNASFSGLIDTITKFGQPIVDALTGDIHDQLGKIVAALTSTAKASDQPVLSIPTGATATVTTSATATPDTSVVSSAPANAATAPPSALSPSHSSLTSSDWTGLAQEIRSLQDAMVAQFDRLIQFFQQNGTGGSSGAGGSAAPKSADSAQSLQDSLVKLVNSGSSIADAAASLGGTIVQSAQAVASYTHQTIQEMANVAGMLDLTGFGLLPGSGSFLVPQYTEGGKYAPGGIHNTDNQTAFDWNGFGIPAGMGANVVQQFTEGGKYTPGAIQDLTPKAAVSTLLPPSPPATDTWAYTLNPHPLPTQTFIITGNNFRNRSDADYLAQQLQNAGIGR